MSWERASTVRVERRQPSQRTLAPSLIALHTPDGAPVPPHRLEDGSYALGRHEAAHIALTDPAVSRQHATLVVEGGGRRIVLEDQSANGTFVDGERRARAELRDGSVVRMGETLLLVRYDLHEPRDAFVEGLLGSSPHVAALRFDLTRIAREDATVLVQGESGTGKELVAQAIHRESHARGPLVAVNCAAISESLAESLLFGHAAGAFTGARHDHEGFFRAAHAGTLFLDEVGDLPESIQPKLLRALESGAVQPVGSALPTPCRVRLVAATHKELAREVDAGRFRGDLYARLSQLTLRTPPLRERREDILPLFRAALGRDHTLPVDVLEALLVEPWRYNVRQLLAVAKRVRVLGVYEGTRDLHAFSHHGEPPTGQSSPCDEREQPPSREDVVAAIERARGNVKRAADALGRSRKQVYRYLALHGIDPEHLRRR